MGIGIIALGLWMLFGFDFTINQIQIFPDIISYVVVLLGIVFSYKKTQQKGFVYALLFPLTNIVLCFFNIDNTLISIMISLGLLVPLYLMLNTIYEIASDYSKKEKYQKYYFLWLAIQSIMLIFMSFEENAPLMLLNILLWIEVFFAILVIYHLVKINKHISDEYEDISYHLPIYKKKHYIRMTVLCLVSVFLIILIEKPYTQSIKEEMVYFEEKFFKVEHADYLVPPFGYEERKETSIFYEEASTSYSALKVYIKEELLIDVDYIKYEIAYNDNLIYKLEGQAKVHENRNSGSYYLEYDAFEGYKEVDIEGQDIYDMKMLKNYSVSSKDEVIFSIELYNENRDVTYTSESPVCHVEPTVYQYEDELISIKDLQYDMNGIVKLPKVKVKDDGSNFTHVNIYFPHEAEGDNVLLLMYSDREFENGTFDLDLRHHFIYDKVDEFKYILIEYHNEGIIVDSRLCELEVVP